MRTQFFLAAVLAIGLGSTTVLAQLGPKDGADLAPTDLNRIKVGQPAPDRPMAQRRAAGAASRPTKRARRPS